MRVSIMGQAPFGEAVLKRLVADGVEVVGVMPKEVEMHFDYTAAVLGYAAQPDEAAAFLAYITRTQARAAWARLTPLTRAIRRGGRRAPGSPRAPRP